MPAFSEWPSWVQAIAAAAAGVLIAYAVVKPQIDRLRFRLYDLERRIAQIDGRKTLDNR